MNEVGTDDYWTDEDLEGLPGPIYRDDPMGDGIWTLYADAMASANAARVETLMAWCLMWASTERDIYQETVEATGFDPPKGEQR